MCDSAVVVQKIHPRVGWKDTRSHTYPYHVICMFHGAIAFAFLLRDVTVAHHDDAHTGFLCTFFFIYIPSSTSQSLTARTSRVDDTDLGC